MKRVLFQSVLAILILIGCNPSGSHSGMSNNTEQESDGGPNQALYDQMMDVHDEVMPRMDEIMRLKRELQELVASSPELIEERRQELEAIISNLDSASTSMMNWMHRIHEANPMADTIDQEKAREYLETEMEEIKKVKDLINNTIEKAQAEVEKK